jgi:hypothetical protein
MTAANSVSVWLSTTTEPVSSSAALARWAGVSAAAAGTGARQERAVASKNGVRGRRIDVADDFAHRGENIGGRADVRRVVPDDRLPARRLPEPFRGRRRHHVVPARGHEEEAFFRQLLGVRERVERGDELGNVVFAAADELKGRAERGRLRVLVKRVHQTPAAEQKAHRL